MDKEKELKKLLAEERIRAGEWRQYYQSLKESHMSLRESYLAAKSEVKKVLEYAKQIKESKDAELESVKSELEEKVKQVDFYMNDLKERERFEECFKEKCKQEMDEFSAKMRKEFEYLKMEKMRLTNENAILKQKNEHLDQDIEIRLKNMSLEHQNELNALNKEKDELRAQFKDAKKHPDYERLMKLTNENQDLREQINNLLALADDTKEKYEKIDEDRERLINEQNVKLRRQETRIANIDQENELQRQEILKLRDELKSNENQLKSLRNSFQDEQSSRETLIQQHVHELKRKQKEFDELKQQSNDEKANYELEIDRIKQEKKKFKNDYEDAKDEVRKLQNLSEQREKDWSKELSKTIQIEKEKFNCLTREKQSLAKEKEESDDSVKRLRGELELKQKQIEEMMSSRYELESETKQLKGQIITMKLNESELEKLKKEYDVLYDDFKKLRIENSELNALTKQLDRENVSLKEQFAIYRNDMEEEKKQFYEYKINCERNLSRSKNSFELERNAMREENEELKDMIRIEKHKRKEIKLKCVQYCEVAKRLHKHLKQFESESGGKVLRSPIKNSIKNPRHIEQSTESELRRQYKEMKRMLNEIQNSDYCKLHQPANS